MAYDTALAARVRDHLEGQAGLSEQPMFGGLGFLIERHLAVAAANRGGLLVRCDPDQTDRLSTEPGVAAFVMRGRAMSGWLRVDPSAVATEADLERWADIGVRYARSLPPR